MTDPLALCPFCGTSNTDRHYLRTAERYDPGCRDCDKSRPMPESVAAVLHVPQLYLTN